MVPKYEIKILFKAIFSTVLGVKLGSRREECTERSSIIFPGCYLSAFVLLLPTLLRRHLLCRFLLSAGRPCEETRLYTYYKVLYCVGCVPTRRYKNWDSARLGLEQPVLLT